MRSPGAIEYHSLPLNIITSITRLWIHALFIAQLKIIIFKWQAKTFIRIYLPFIWCGYVL